MNAEEDTDAHIQRINKGKPSDTNKNTSNSRNL